jgi:glycosyltransferase involved in cell wall biosynthesis
MKILHIITRMILGGAQENTLLTVLGQMKRGHEVVLCTGPTSGPEGSLLAEAQAKGVPLIETPFLLREISPVADARAYYALRKIIRDVRPDVVHTHSSKAGILGRLAAWKEKTPFVIHTIHGLPFHPYQSKLKNAVYIAAEKIAAARCHKIACVAYAMAEKALAAGIATPEKYITVYSGMRTEEFLREPVDREAIREKYGFAPDDFVIGKIARLFELKGHDYLLDVFAELIRDFPSARLFFVGDGSWREWLEEKAHALDIAPRVTFAGLVPHKDVAGAIHAMDMVAHCSLREGLARVLPQALLAGKPVVSFDIDGAREVVKNNETGWLVPPLDLPGLGKAIREIMTDLSAALKLAETGRKLCAERFDWQLMADRLLDIYRHGLDAQNQ